MSYQGGERFAVIIILPALIQECLWESGKCHLQLQQPGGAALTRTKAYLDLWLCPSVEAGCWTLLMIATRQAVRVCASDRDIMKQGTTPQRTATVPCRSLRLLGPVLPEQKYVATQTLCQD